MLEGKLLTFSLDLSLKSLKNALEIKSYMISFLYILPYFSKSSPTKDQLGLIGVVGVETGQRVVLVNILIFPGR